MKESIDLERIERNVFHDYFEDGLVDMLFGAYFLLLGLLLPGGSVAPIIVLFVAFYVPLLKALKKRFTYPRIGYAELREGDPKALPWFVLGSLVLGLAALVGTLIAVGVIAQPDQWYRWMPIFFGIWMGGIMLGLGLRASVARYYVGAGTALVCGPAITLLALTGKLAHLGLFLAIEGALMLVCGSFVFVRFLRRQPLPREETIDAID